MTLTMPLAEGLISSDAADICSICEAWKPPHPQSGPARRSLIGQFGAFFSLFGPFDR